MYKPDDPRTAAAQLTDELAAYETELNKLKARSLGNYDFAMERNALANKYARNFKGYIETQKQYSKKLAVITQITSKLHELKTSVSFEWGFLKSLASDLTLFNLEPQYRDNLKKSYEAVLYATVGKNIDKTENDKVFIALSFSLMCINHGLQSDEYGKAMRTINDADIEIVKAELQKFKAGLKQDQEVLPFISTLHRLAGKFTENTEVANTLAQFAGKYVPARRTSPILSPDSSFADIYSFVEANSPTPKQKGIIAGKLCSLDLGRGGNIRIALEIIAKLAVNDLDHAEIIKQDDGKIESYSYVLLHLSQLQLHAAQNEQLSNAVTNTLSGNLAYLEANNVFNTLLEQYADSESSEDYMIIASRYAKALRYIGFKPEKQNIFEAALIKHPKWKEQSRVSASEQAVIDALKIHLHSDIPLPIAFEADAAEFIFQEDALVTVTLNGKTLKFNIECDGDAHIGETKKAKDELRDNILQEQAKTSVIRVKHTKYPDQAKINQFISLKIKGSMLLQILPDSRDDLEELLTVDHDSFSERNYSTACSVISAYLNLQLTFDKIAAIFSIPSSNDPALVSMCASIVPIAPHLVAAKALSVDELREKGKKYAIGINAQCNMVNNTYKEIQDYQSATSRSTASPVIYLASLAGSTTPPRSGQRSPTGASPSKP